MSLVAIGVDITTVGTTPLFAPGARGAIEDQTTGSGVREYMYVSVPASTALAVGDVVLVGATGAVAAASTTTTTPGNAAGPRVGVVVTAVSSSTSVQYAWVQIYGLGSVRVLASCAANTQINTTATAGALDDDATAGAEVIDGIRLTTANGGATAAVAAYINYPFVGRTL